ncbi:MAG: nitrite reductase/ring-hydroxylating ferredoxin subunit [Planctomycetota bacterium]|jgi:nitrite reductase/ring-hydroxylating ferredoxin subunit
MAWQASVKTDQVPVGALAVWKHDGQQYVISHTDDGEFHVLDNRCPHEGYPLTSGELKGTALTCSWHNWKFDVRSGACMLGEEGVRSFPSRVEDGVVLVDLSEPNPEDGWPALLSSFDEGLFKHQVGRSARDGVRLLKSGYDPHELLARIALYDARHAEYGTTHALAIAADCGRLLDRYTGMDAMYAIAPAIDMCGDSNRRLPARERPTAIPGATEVNLRAAVEAEDTERALGLLRGAFDADLPRATIEGWLFAILSDHFLNFGHQLIYLVKAQELFERGAEELAEEIYEGLLFNILMGTREDTLPYMRSYFDRFTTCGKELEDLWQAAGEDPQYDCRAITTATLDGTLDDAFHSVLMALESGASLAAIAQAIVLAAAERFYRFDVAIDADQDVSETWLWVTHRLTFASAVRVALERFQSPDAIRFLIQALAFVHTGKDMDALPQNRTRLEAREMSPAEVVAAIADKDAQGAVSGTLGLVNNPEQLRVLRTALEDLSLSDPLVRPIVIVHVVKTLLASFDEFDALARHPDRHWPLVACVRFLASPVVERRVAEQVRRSIHWVAEGKMPRKLTQ